MVWDRNSEGDLCVGCLGRGFVIEMFSNSAIPTYLFNFFQPKMR